MLEKTKRKVKMRKMIFLVLVLVLVAIMATPTVAQAEDEPPRPDYYCEETEAGWNPAGCWILDHYFGGPRYLLVGTQIPEQRYYVTSGYQFCIGNQDGCQYYPAKIRVSIYHEWNEDILEDDVYIVSLPPREGPYKLWILKEQWDYWEKTLNILQQPIIGSSAWGEVCEGDITVYPGYREYKHRLEVFSSESGIDLGGPNCYAVSGECWGSEFFH